MCILARLLIAHLLGDIPLNLFASQKRNGTLFYRFVILSLHATIVFLANLLLFVDKLNQTVLGCFLLVAAAHFLIDALRLRIEDRVFVQARVTQPPRTKREGLMRLRRFFKDPRASWCEDWFRKWFLLNILDQCLHLVVLVLAAGYLGRVL